MNEVPLITGDMVDFSKEEAEEKGYEWNIVEFLKKEDPDLLFYIWDNLSPLYISILKNTITEEDLANHLIGNKDVEKLMFRAQNQAYSKDKTGRYSDRAMWALARYRFLSK